MTHTIIAGDCLNIMRSWPGSKCVDLILTDPPYGMNWNPDSSRFTGGAMDFQNRRGNGGGRHKTPIAHDNHSFDPTPWLSFPKVCLWGYNHFGRNLPVGTTLIWIKRNEHAFGTFLSDAELAWMKGGHGVYCRRDLSMKAVERDRQHPNQKPVSLMRWCLEKMGAQPGQTVLDPYCGVGTTALACIQMGLHFIGIEIEPAYVKIAQERIARERNQLKLNL